MSQLFQYLEAAENANTRRSYASAIRHFEIEWKGLLPSTPDAISRYLAAFTLTGKNLTLDPGMAAERARLDAQQPAWIQAARPLLNGARLLSKIRHGGYHQACPLSYQLYVDPDQPRRTFTAEHPSFRWTWT